MTVAATTNRKTYTGDNVTTSFATSPVIFYATSDLQVRVTVIATGVSTLLTLNTHYTVSGGSSAGAVGTVSLAGGSSPHGALLSTEKLVILRVLPLTQGVDFVNNNNSDAEVIEAALDKLTDVDQQIQEQADRSIRFASGDVSGSVTEIPDVTTRAGRILGFDATGLLTTFVVSVGTSLVNLAAAGGSALIGFIQAGTGAVLRTLQSKARETVSVTDFGGGTSAQNTAALVLAMAASDEVTVTPGTYDNLTISSSNKTLRMQAGVTFKIPNGTVAGGAVTGPAVFGVSGASVTVIGDFTIDGNKANNDASSFPTTEITGSLHITGANCRLEGTVTVNNAYWRGFTVTGGDNTGQEIDTFYARCLKFSAPTSYATMLWTAKNFHIDRIEVVRGTNLDARVRLGTQTSSTGQCKDGYIGSIKTDSTVAFEAKAYNVEIGSVNCALFKYQDATDCHVDKVTADYRSGYTADQADAFGIGFSTATRCSIGVGRVTRFDCTTQSAFTVGGTAGIGSIDCRIGALFVDGTLHAVTDCRIITADGLDIGYMSLKSSIGTGFLFDTGPDTLTPQRRISIGALVSIGHTTDVSIESAGAARNEQIKIDYINPDAVIANGGGEMPMGTFLWPTTTASVAVTNGFVTAKSIVQVIPVDAAAGVVVQTKGFYVTVAAGAFTIHTGDATNTAANSNWNYKVISQVTPTA